MAEFEIIQKTDTATTLKAVGSGQQLNVPSQLPILPLKNIVLFPGAVMQLEVPKALLEEVMLGDKVFGVVAQKNIDSRVPTMDDLYGVGVVCVVLKLFRMRDATQAVIVHGLTRFRLLSMVQSEPYISAKVEVLAETSPTGTEIEALVASVRQQATRMIELTPDAPEEASQVLSNITSPSLLADFLASNLPKGQVAERQRLLEEFDIEKRLRALAAVMASQLDVMELQSRINDQVKENIDKSQRRYYLQEQMKAIKKELGGSDAGGTGGSEADDLREKLKAANPPEGVMKEAERELERLDAIPNASPEYGVIRTYLQILAELPWTVETTDKIDLTQARAILDRDHHDLDKVKRRIIEYLAVRKLKPDGGGAILCFVGPPGVGKTSLGKSIAEAMERKFIRVALGGVRDEADIRGHRRTYIGSMPGRIIAEIRKAGTRNPVMMLDEIDKLGSDFRGDPSSALLEVLDPAQNHTFTDHYLDVPFDLSHVLFIATANTMDTVPGPLRDRMEVIEIPGYTSSDKLSIARQYLVPRQLEANGVKREQARFNETALKWIIDGYTREAGVRALERAIGSVARSVAADIVGGKTQSALISRDRVGEILGPRRFDPELAARTSVPGVATGMAFTPVGGEILFIEATRMPGKGQITLTGQIGDVMKESATAAYSLIRSRAKELGVDPELLANSDFHIHVPAGAVPKDGPSAGVAMFTSLASLMLNRPVRHDLAMTGEITLRGLVLPIGGLKEKTLAAKRAGIRQVIVPKRNEKDMPDIPLEVRETLKFHFVENIDQVLRLALIPIAAPGKNGQTKKPSAPPRLAAPLAGHGAQAASAETPRKRGR
jgi:ATP-dependent Lon protease